MTGSGVASAGYRWYLGAQVISLAGTMMGYTALFWLVLHIAHGGAPALAAVDAAQCLPMLLFSRRAGVVVARHRAARVAVVTQALQAAGALAIGIPLLASWMTIWYRLRWLAELPGGVRAAAAMALLVGGFGYQFAVTNPLMASRVFHLGAAGFGLFGTCMAVGGIAGTYYSSRRQDPGPREFLIWALVFGAAECLAALAPAAWAYGAAMVVTGAAVQLFAVSATVYIQQSAPPAQRGLALSAYNAGFIGFVPAGAFAVAGIASAAGVRWALAGPGLAALGCGAALAIAGGCRTPARSWLTWTRSTGEEGPSRRPGRGGKKYSAD